MTRARSEPRWVHRAVVRAIQADQIRQHGGLPGLRDEGLLESALERPRNRWCCEPDTELARNHAFTDGNRRVASW